MSARRPRPAAFLDRDGTLNVEVEGALASARQVELLPGAAAAVARLNAAGLPVVVVSNQSAIARGWLDHERLARVQDELARRLAAAGARVDLWIACPHHPDEGLAPYRRACPCRKPAPGLLREAARRLDLDLSASWIVGDAARDLAAGAAVGARGILVRTGKGQRELGRLSAEGRAPEHVAPDLAGAVALLLQAR